MEASERPEAADPSDNASLAPCAEEVRMPFARQSFVLGRIFTSPKRSSCSSGDEVSRVDTN